MIYFLWQTGRFTNQKISELFGLSYSSVSKRVSIFREKLRVDKTFKKKYDEIRALSKISSQNWRSDLGWIWSIRLSKTTGIAGYFEDFANEDRPKTA